MNQIRRHFDSIGGKDRKKDSDNYSREVASTLQKELSNLYARDFGKEDYKKGKSISPV